MLQQPPAGPPAPIRLATMSAAATAGAAAAELQQQQQQQQQPAAGGSSSIAAAAEQPPARSSKQHAQQKQQHFQQQQQQQQQQQKAFAAGEVVSIKRHGAATVLAGPAADGDEFAGRYQVRYLDSGATYWVNPSSMRLLPKPPARLLVCETTKHYRSAALQYGHPHDTVLEVGCHEGVTTDMLHSRVKWVVGIDKSWDPVARARARYPHVNFRQLDGFDVGALTALSPSGAYDKIFIDIGGIAELHVVMALVGLYWRSFRGAHLIVKSKYMRHLLMGSQVYVPAIELQQAGNKQQRQQQQRESRQQQQREQQQLQQQQQEQQQQDGAPPPSSLVTGV